MCEMKTRGPAEDNRTKRSTREGLFQHSDMQSRWITKKKRASKATTRKPSESVGDSDRSPRPSEAE